MRNVTIINYSIKTSPLISFRDVNCDTPRIRRRPVFAPSRAAKLNNESERRKTETEKRKCRICARPRNAPYTTLIITRNYWMQLSRIVGERARGFISQSAARPCTKARVRVIVIGVTEKTQTARERECIMRARALYLYLHAVIRCRRSQRGCATTV